MERDLLDSLRQRLRVGALLLAACCPWTGCLADDSADTLVDGQLFTALMAEGVEMTFKVISAAERTCAVGGGADQWDGTRTTAVAESTEGVVTIPANVNGFDVVAIEDEAFYGCGSVTEIILPNTLKQLSGPNSWLIGSFLFWGCGMTRIVILMAGGYGDESLWKRADVNGDGEVGIGNIVAITNIMAGQ